MRMWQTLVVVPALGLAVWADDKEPVKAPPKAAEPGTLVVLDAAGKEQKLKAWKFAAGTRRLGWLAPDKPAPKGPEKKEPAKEGAAPEPPAGPEALEIRAATEIEFADGVVTLVPLDQMRSLDYDAEQETVTARVAADPAGDETLVGATKYKRINKLVLEAEVDKGELGVAEVRYLGGLPRGIRGLRFPPPRPSRPFTGRPATVTSADGKIKAAHKVLDLLPLYQFSDKGEKLLPTLLFKKTLKIDVSKIRKITVEGEGDEATWQVALKSGGDESLVLLPTIEVEGRKGVLVGLVGRVPAGFKLFPVAAIAEIVFDTDDAPKPKDEKPKPGDK